MDNRPRANPHTSPLVFLISLFTALFNTASMCHAMSPYPGVFLLNPEAGSIDHYLMGILNVESLRALSALYFTLVFYLKYMVQSNHLHVCYSLSHSIKQSAWRHRQRKGLVSWITFWSKAYPVCRESSWWLCFAIDRVL